MQGWVDVVSQRWMTLPLQPSHQPGALPDPITKSGKVWQKIHTTGNRESHPLTSFFLNQSKNKNKGSAPIKVTFHDTDTDSPTSLCPTCAISRNYSCGSWTGKLPIILARMSVSWNTAFIPTLCCRENKENKLLYKNHLCRIQSSRTAPTATLTSVH